MKKLLVLAGACALSPMAASAQTPAPAPAPAAPLTGDSPVEAIAATEAGKASLNKNLPEVLAHPAYEQFKGMSLRALAPLAGEIITDEKIAAVEADLKAAGAAKPAAN